jgi:rare lipoprotein A
MFKKGHLMIKHLTSWKITAGAVAGVLALVSWPTEAEAKRPGGKHCYGGTCHRVMTLDETQALVGKLRKLRASHYDDCRRDRFNPCGLTSSGEPFRAHAPDNTASAIHPDGTVLLLRNPSNRLSAVVRVNNFGPFRGNRQLDVSRATAERLGFAKQGVAALEALVVQAPTPAEARYKRNRRYEPVPGFMGHADSIDSAFQRYADLTMTQRIARLDRIACQIAANRRAPRLGLMVAASATPRQRLARG